MTQVRVTINWRLGYPRKALFRLGAQDTLLRGRLWRRRSYSNPENSVFCCPPIYNITLHSCTALSRVSPRRQACVGWCGCTTGLRARILSHIWCVRIFFKAESSLSLTSAVVLDSHRFWACSLGIYFEKTRRRRGHLALMSPRRYKQYLRRTRFSILVHGTDAEHPVLLRKCFVPW